MNKFTLQFQNKELEKQYQNQSDKIRYPLFLVIAIFSIIAFGLQVILGLVKNQFDSYFYLSLALQVGYIISLMVTYKRKQYVSPCMIILLQIGVVFISYPYRYERDCNIFLTNAQCFFMFYVILGFVIDYFYSIVGIFLTTISIICIILTLDLQISLMGILLGGGLLGFFCFCRYYFEWVNKQTFLLTLKDKSWEKELNIIYHKKQISIQLFVSTIIENQFLILFDEDTDLIKQIRTKNQQNKKQLIIKFIHFLHSLLFLIDQAIQKQKNVLLILQQLNGCNLYQQLFLGQELQNEVQTITIESLINLLNNKILLKSFYTRSAMNSLKISTLPNILVLLIQKVTRLLKGRDVFLFILYPSQQEPFYTINLQVKNDQPQTDQFRQQSQFEIQKEIELKQLLAKIAYKVRILSDIQNNQEKIIQIFMKKLDETFIL